MFRLHFVVGNKSKALKYSERLRKKPESGVKDMCERQKDGWFDDLATPTATERTLPYMRLTFLYCFSLQVNHAHEHAPFCHKPLGGRRQAAQ